MITGCWIVAGSPFPERWKRKADRSKKRLGFKTFKPFKRCAPFKTLSEKYGSGGCKFLRRAPFHSAQLKRRLRAVVGVPFNFKGQVFEFRFRREPTFTLAPRC